jgi:hypothetical protein
MALNPTRVLMPKHHSVRHKTPRLAFCGSKHIKANPLVLAIRPSKARAPFVNLNWSNITLAEQYVLH